MKHLVRFFSLAAAAAAAFAVVACGDDDSGSGGNTGGGAGNGAAGSALDAACVSCLQGNCNAEVTKAYGSAWATGNMSGGTCGPMYTCMQNCGNDLGCMQTNCASLATAECNTDGTAAEDCMTAHCNTQCNGSAGAGGSAGSAGSSSSGGDCTTLAACCTTLPTEDAKSGCAAVAQGGETATCSQLITSLQQAGYCK